VKNQSVWAAVIALLLFSPCSAIPQPTIDSFGLDDLMTLLIQPRHLKLYAAATQRNWELAAAESRDLRAALGRIAQTIPRYMNNDVADSIKIMISPQLQAVDTAIAAADVKRFQASYVDLTAACNACHVYMEHPYIVIQVPAPGEPPSYPDQEFRPTP
jgi:hypothetical protein